MIRQFCESGPATRDGPALHEVRLAPHAHHPAHAPSSALRRNPTPAAASPPPASPAPERCAARVTLRSWTAHPYRPKRIVHPTVTVGRIRSTYQPCKITLLGPV